MPFDLSGRWIPASAAGAPQAQSLWIPNTAEDAARRAAGGGASPSLPTTRPVPLTPASAAPSGLADLVANLQRNMGGPGPGMDLLAGRPQIGAPTAPVAAPTRPSGRPVDSGRWGPSRAQARQALQEASSTGGFAPATGSALNALQSLRGAGPLPPPTSGIQGSNATPWGNASPWDQASGLQQIASMLRRGG